VILGWECAECSDQSKGIVAVCHHCGKPLCEEDLVVILDDAFAGVPRKPRHGAVHCRKCRREYHLGSLSLGKESR
jgi:hypothetical protein